MINRDSFVIHARHIEIAQERLDDEQMGVLLKAILAFEKGEKVELYDPTIKLIFDFIVSTEAIIKQQIEQKE